jgi:hypothetical protein
MTVQQPRRTKKTNTTTGVKRAGVAFLAAKPLTVNKEQLVAS